MLPDVEPLFELLDVDSDGRLSRENLYQAALKLGWHWHEARLFAVLDRLTIEKPLTRDDFRSCIELIAQDPYGPFGQILKRLPIPKPATNHIKRQTPAATGERIDVDKLVTSLENSVGPEVAQHYDALLNKLDKSPLPLSTVDTALLIIDPQRSFITGTWMLSIGTDGPRQVGPIKLAFQHCTQLLSEIEKDASVMFTRCPFPPTSYLWHEDLNKLLAPNQPYFVKPGNSVLWPPTNGFADWVQLLLKDGRQTLVIGGCTLNSCVRVSAIETQHRFEKDGLQVVVDLSICGARLDNYVQSSMFGGRSSVVAAVQEMMENGVRVVSGVLWKNESRSNV